MATVVKVVGSGGTADAGDRQEIPPMMIFIIIRSKLLLATTATTHIIRMYSSHRVTTSG